MKKIKTALLVYDAMRAKEMGKVIGGYFEREHGGYCTYCGRSLPYGGYDCGVCRPRCFMCGEVIDFGMPHYCKGGLGLIE